jgi:hypothetical protein
MGKRWATKQNLLLRAPGPGPWPGQSGDGDISISLDSKSHGDEFDGLPAGSPGAGFSTDALFECGNLFLLTFSMVESLPYWVEYRP